MSTKQHTDGPWNIHPAYQEPEILAVDETPAWAFCQTYIAQGEKIIAQAQMSTSPNGGFPKVDNRGEMMANARLIAAAPELLEVLQELEESSSYWSDYDVPVGIVDRIKAAIARATGKELATPLAIPPMPTPELKCKGWLCFMLATDLENAGWKDGLCPECLDELERERIREEQSERRYEP